nr:hypothetical protein [Navicula tsukamotoi]
MKFFKTIKDTLNILSSLFILILEQILLFIYRRPFLSLIFGFFIFIQSLPLPVQNMSTLPLFCQDSRITPSIESILKSLEENPSLGDESKFYEFEFDKFEHLKQRDVVIGYEEIAEKNLLKKIQARYSFPAIERKIFQSSIPVIPNVGTRESLSKNDNIILSIRAERRLNKRCRCKRTEPNRQKVGVTIRDWIPFYHPYQQILDKYYHAWEIVNVKDLPISKQTLIRTQNMVERCGMRGYLWRIEYLRSAPAIEEKDLKRVSDLLRKHLLDSDTKIIVGTLGNNRQRKVDEQRQENPNLERSLKIKGYLVYNSKTRIVSFYDYNNRNLRTYMKVNEHQLRDIIINHNLL